MKKYLVNQKSFVAMIILLVLITIAPIISGIEFTEFSNFVITAPVQMNDGFNVSIVKPQRALYIFDMKIWPTRIGEIIGFGKNVDCGMVFGSVTIDIDASYTPPGNIHHVEIFIDNVCVATVNETPYDYFWNYRSFGIYSIHARAFNDEGRYFDTEPIRIIKIG